MKTIKEKVAILEEFEKKYEKIVARISEVKDVMSQEGDRIERDFTEICMPVVQMYTDVICEAINPTSQVSAFCLIYALEAVIASVKRCNKVKERMVNHLRNTISQSTEKISVDDEFLKKKIEEI